MGKVKKARQRAVVKEVHGKSLSDSIEPTVSKSSKKAKEKNHQGETLLKSEKTTERILNTAREQLEELEENQTPQTSKMSKNFKFSRSDEDEEGIDGSDMLENLEISNLEIDNCDMKSLHQFMNPNPAARKTIADLIMEKLAEKQENVSEMNKDEEEDLPELSPALTEGYNNLAKFLQIYRSGKVPKLLKFLPRLRDYEKILGMLNPDSWTAASVLQATKYFSSFTKERAQKFYYYILLPRVRDDIEYYKRLNVHLYMSLKKALFQPESFNKGILFPLCEEGTCTLREAVIIGSVLAKSSFPQQHASVAIYVIAEMKKYYGANSIFLRVLIMKKYTLPFQVIDAVVNHFLSFMRDTRELPVLWHLCLKSFAENYGKDCSSEQRESLLELLKAHKHEKISADIRRILQQTESRDVEMFEAQ